MTRRSDAAIAGGLLVATLALAWYLGVAVRTAVAGVGAAMAVAAELLAYGYEDQVRSLWADLRVRIGSTLAAASAILAGAALAPAPALSLAVGALGAYLLLLGIVAARERLCG